MKSIVKMLAGAVLLGGISLGSAGCETMQQINEGLDKMERITGNLSQANVNDVGGNDANQGTNAGNGGFGNGNIFGSSGSNNGGSGGSSNGGSGGSSNGGTRHHYRRTGGSTTTTTTVTSRPTIQFPKPKLPSVPTFRPSPVKLPTLATFKPKLPSVPTVNLPKPKFPKF